MSSPGAHGTSSLRGENGAVQAHSLLREDIDEWELFDLESDSLEMHNLYGEPGNETLVKELKAELKRLQILYEDPIWRNIRFRFLLFKERLSGSVR